MTACKAAAIFLVLLVTAVAAGDINHPTGTNGVLLIDKLGAHIRFLDPRTLTDTGQFAVASNPHDFALSPDHSRAYVPIYGDGVYGNNPHPGHEIYVVDLVKHAVASIIDVSPYLAPHAVQVDAAGVIYVACDQDRKLLVIEPRELKVTAAIDTEGTGHWMALLPNGRKMYVANKNDKPFVSVIDLQARKVVGHIPMPNGTQGIAASPDGRRVVALDYAEPKMFVIDTASDRVIDSVMLTENTRGYKPYFSPDGKTLVTMGTDPTINIFDASDLHREQAVLKVGRSPMGVAFSADGSTLLVANHGDGSVSVVDLPTKHLIRSFHAGTGIETLTYY